MSKRVGPRPSVAFLEWTDPIYVGGHWTPELIARAGGRHPLNEAGAGGAGKSFPVTDEAVLQSKPELVVVCPCGLDLAATRREVAQMRQQSWWQQLTARIVTERQLQGPFR